jgi:ferritin
MLSKTIQDAINEQIKNEIQSAYLYLAMAQHCESVNLSGSGRWLTMQWHEELEHAEKLIGYMHNRGGRVVLGAIEKPQTDFPSIKDVFTQVLAHEQKVTALINQLYTLAIKENDYATQVELQWFIKEQVEEEKHATEILDQLKMVGDSSTTLFFLDRQLGARAK